MKALVISPAAQRDEGSIQMMSAWIAERGLHCSLNVGMWHAMGRKESSAWGILLADAIRHIANALQQEFGQATPDTVSAILGALHKELGEPTSAVSGVFHPGHS